MFIEMSRLVVARGLGWGRERSDRGYEGILVIDLVHACPGAVAT